MAERVEDRDGDAVASVGILGGTGALGRGLASRLAPVVGSVVLGSRDVERARATAGSLEGAGTGTVEGGTNADACGADFVIVAVPWAAHDALLAEVSDELRGRILIDAVNPLGFDKSGAFVLPVEAGSATQRAQQLVPQGRVVGAFHHVAASALSSGEPLDMDVLVVGDHREAVDAVCGLIDRVAGLRAIRAGRLRNAAQVEAITANLISINRTYRTQSGLRVTGV